MATAMKLPLDQLQDTDALLAGMFADAPGADALDEAFGSGRKAPQPLVLAGMNPQGEIDDVDGWLVKIRGERTDNTRTAIRRTVKPQSINAVLDDELVRAAFQEEAAMIHAAGQRVHGFAFEAAWCSALRRAGFNATLCRAGSQADVAIAFEEPPPPDNVIGVQLKSNERHLKAQMAGKDYDVKDTIRIPAYASIDNPMKEFVARLEQGGRQWQLDDAFPHDDPEHGGEMGAATTYVTTRHMQGYDAILYCETSFTHDLEQHEIQFRLSSIDVQAMRGAMAGAMAYDLPEAVPGSGMRVAPYRHKGTISSWHVDYFSAGDPPEHLFRTRIYSEGRINIEQITRAGALVTEHEPIITPATIEIGINDPADVPPVIKGKRFDPLGRMAPELLGHTIEADDGLDCADEIEIRGLDF